TSHHPLVHSTGEITLEHSARSSSRGSIPWPGAVARSVPEILSAGEPKRQATTTFAAFRQQEHTHKLAPP
ncbi:MAG: hypothetical protein ACLPND_04570, partial [Candidatus Korobacteraceae bacterium]